MAEYQVAVIREIEARLKAKCDKLADAFIDDIGSLMYRTLLLFPLYYAVYVTFYCCMRFCLVIHHGDNRAFILVEQSDYCI